MTGPRLLLTISLAIAAMCAAIALATGDPYAVIRWTARSSLVLFALAYVARPATQLWRSPLTKRLLAERKWIGDGFAVSHLAHFIAICAAAATDWQAFMAGRSAATLFALFVFAVLFAMAITSIDRVRKAMSRRAWNALHLTGMHLIWIVFVSSYAKRVAQTPILALPFGLLLAIASVRAAAWVRARGKARARASVAA